ncbi:hypothetical protein K458DRAFT_466112 [Lentithecium fluviatile CBS 122367]|uniref:Uncharacterized protein n=1 Tax=Lentithecium fluviatile CBS 122367 TaxID=1168545 RepID=A0A6G1IHM3_9PLEO|nr:hypothetical protein K458DRAFT_466112 [Lentithecium fluviatile CBS 122367]
MGKELRDKERGPRAKAKGVRWWFDYLRRRCEFGHCGGSFVMGRSEPEMAVRKHGPEIPSYSWLALPEDFGGTGKANLQLAFLENIPCFLFTADHFYHYHVYFGWVLMKRKREAERTEGEVNRENGELVEEDREAEGRTGFIKTPFQNTAEVLRRWSEYI